jgi:hypothetical protein
MLEKSFVQALILLYRLMKTIIKKWEEKFHNSNAHAYKYNITAFRDHTLSDTFSNGVNQANNSFC